MPVCSGISPQLCCWRLDRHTGTQAVADNVHTVAFAGVVQVRDKASCPSVDEGERGSNHYKALLGSKQEGAAHLMSCCWASWAASRRLRTMSFSRSLAARARLSQSAWSCRACVSRSYAPCAVGGLMPVHHRTSGRLSRAARAAELTGHLPCHCQAGPFTAVGLSGT